MLLKRIIPFVFLSALFLTYSCSDKIEPGTTASKATQTIQARVAIAEMTTQPYLYEAVGTVAARISSTVSAKLMGTVTAVYTREGDEIKQGAVLAVIDDRQVSAQLRQAQAGLAEARQAESAALSARDAALAGVVLARATHNRYLRLIQDESVSRQEFDEVEARRHQAEAAFKQADAMVEAVRQRIQQAEAAVTAVEVSKKDAKILAPFNGIVTAKLVEVGDLAAPGKPLFILEKKGGIRVDVVIPEAHIEAIKPNQKLKVTLPALQSQVITGTVQTIVPGADPQSRSFIVKVDLPAGTAIPSGLFARITVPLGDSPLLLIPASAVVAQGQLTGVYLVDAEGIARFRLIRTGRKFDDSAEVLSGLPEGSRYVVAPPPALVDGARVEVGS
ncbi:MAG: efflux RND transporter periplasmic adaptor subunit [Desulfobacterales bacterium]|nr:efflux RND transporter periplasmic adaptor subunit [Desulfobacterales bacterium]